jgi:hypothetical protein
VSSGFSPRGSGTPFQSGSTCLPRIQPAQQFTRLGSGQFFDFFDSEFNRTHATYLSEEIGSQQAVSSAPGHKYFFIANASLSR